MKNLIVAASIATYLAALGIGVVVNPPSPNLSLSLKTVAWNQLWEKEFKFPHSKTSD